MKTTALVLHADTPAGRAACSAILARDMQLLTVCRSGRQDQPTCENVVRAEVINTSNVSDVASLAKRLEADGHTIDILVSAPATVAADTPDDLFVAFEEFDPDLWDEMMARDLKAPMLFAQEFGRRMKLRGKGKIIQLVGNVAQDPHDPRHAAGVVRDNKGHAPAASASAMAGLMALGRHLAADHMDSGVLVNNLVHGPLREAEPVALISAYQARVPVGRVMSEKDLADALDLLLDPRNEYITGQNIVVDGGVSIW